MTPQQLRALRTLARLADQLEPAARDAFQQALRRLQLTADVEAAAEALRAGDVETAMRALLPLGGAAALTHGLRVAVARIIAEVGPQAAKEIASIVRVGFHFVPGSPAAADALQRLALSSIVPVTRDAEAGLRAVLTDGLWAGTNPRVVAREAKAFVGLTDYDATIVRSFVDQLRSDPALALTRELRDKRYDATLARAIDGAALSDGQVAAMREAYVRKLTAWRSETWARTTTLDTIKATQRAGWQQLAAEFDLGDRSITRRWVTAHDDRVRPEHAAMDGATTALDQPYRNGQWYPGAGDWNCRCVETYAVAAP